MRNVLRGKQDRLSRSRASFGALPAMYHHRHGEGRAHPFSHHSPSPGPGTLRQILALQNRSMEETDEKILALLKKLGLAHPLTPGDLDSEQDWSTLLSPREQRLVALASAIIAAPSYILLRRPMPFSATNFCPTSSGSWRNEGLRASTSPNRVLHAQPMMLFSNIVRTALGSGSTKIGRSDYSRGWDTLFMIDSSFIEPSDQSRWRRLNS